MEIFDGEFMKREKKNVSELFINCIFAAIRCHKAYLSFLICMSLSFLFMKTSFQFCCAFRSNYGNIYRPLPIYMR